MSLRFKRETRTPRATRGRVVASAGVRFAARFHFTLRTAAMAHQRGAMAGPEKSGTHRSGHGAGLYYVAHHS